MRTGKKVLLGLILATMIIAYPQFGQAAEIGALQNNQGLEWAVEPGDRYSYTASQLSNEYLNFTDLSLYVDVILLPVLEDDLTDLALVYLTKGANYELYYANGTVIPFISPYLGWFAYPVGDFQLLMTLLNSSISYIYYSINWFEDDLEWGFVLVHGSNEYKTTYTFAISKEDGVANYILVDSYWSNSPSDSFELIRDGYTPSESYVDKIMYPNGFWWGVAEGDSIGYTYNYYYPTTGQTSFHFNVVIDFLPVIGEDVSWTYQLVLHENHYSMRFDNGSEIEMTPYMYIPMAVLPLGNWDLIEQILDPSFFGMTSSSGPMDWTETQDDIGFEMILDYSNQRMEANMRFSKLDGAMNLFRYEVFMGGLRVGYVEVVRDVQGFFLSPEAAVPIIVGGGIVAIAAVALVLTRKWG